MSQQYTLLDVAAPRTIATGSTDADPIVITSAAHGLATGDRITLFGHTTNTNANGTWVVTVTAANVFSLDGSTGTGSAGGADGCFAKQNAIAFIPDGYDAELTVDTDGGGDAAMTVKFALSDQEDAPDFAAPQAVDNEYEYAYCNDLEDPANENIAGDTGLVLTGDDHRKFGVNSNGGTWLAAIPTAGTEGEVTVKTTLFKRN